MDCKNTEYGGNDAIDTFYLKKYMEYRLGVADHAPVASWSV
jgi:hypothetical protein